MPFTPSHLAAALPFVRTPLIPAAVAIGTMTPDLFYYLPVAIDRETAHSWLGVVTVDLAFGIALVLLWRFFLREPVIDFMPQWVRARMTPSEWMSAGRLRWPRLVLVLVASLLVGSATHVLWDALTHDGAFVHLLPVLYEQVGPLRVFKWLQHTSSLLGAVALVLFIRWWYRRTAVHEVPPSKLGPRGRVVGIIVVLGAGLAVATYAWLRGFLAHGYSPIDNALIFYTVTIGIAAAGLAAVLVCVVWWGLRFRSSTIDGDPAAETMTNRMRQ